MKAEDDTYRSSISFPLSSFQPVDYVMTGGLLPSHKLLDGFLDRLRWLL
jgi:hypothetical protein